MTAPFARLALLLLLLICIHSTYAFHPSSISLSTTTTTLLSLRGGGEEEYDSDYDSEYDSDEEEPIIQKSKALASSTKSKIRKSKHVASKSKLGGAMAASKPKQGGGSYKHFVPHIVRAILNPFTFVRMSRAYFASLLDINYMKEEPAQNLRSALEEKARKAPSSGGAPNKPKRKMKPGQAKTLSDLPQLSA